MTWLQGGPFLEISFLLALDTDRQTFIETILTKLKSFSPTVDFATTEKELKEKVVEFRNGYRDNEQDPNSIMYHSTQIPIYIDTDGKRKSILALEQISSKLIEVNFWFFGSVWDVPEWNQKGITENQIPYFKNILHKLFDSFEFILGTIGYEVSSTDLFETEDGWPSEKYILDNIKIEALQGDHYFLTIIVNKKYLDLQDIDGLQTKGQKQVIEKTHRT